jgi:hypothetical protein
MQMRLKGLIKPIADLFPHTTIMFADMLGSPLGALQRNRRRCSTLSRTFTGLR